jgi:hypothetical protein
MTGQFYVIPSSTRMHFRTFQVYNLQECAYEELMMPNTPSHDCQPTSGDYCVEAEVAMNLKIQLQSNQASAMIFAGFEKKKTVKIKLVKQI